MTKDRIEAVARALINALAVFDKQAGWDHANERDREQARSLAKDTIAALRDEGMVVVPREPTKDMTIAVNAAALQRIGFKSGWMTTEVGAWKRGHAAMLSAAPKADLPTRSPDGTEGT